MQNCWISGSETKYLQSSTLYFVAFYLSKQSPDFVVLSGFNIYILIVMSLLLVHRQVYCSFHFGQVLKLCKRKVEKLIFSVSTNIMNKLSVPWMALFSSFFFFFCKNELTKQSYPHRKNTNSEHCEFVSDCSIDP